MSGVLLSRPAYKPNSVSAEADDSHLSVIAVAGMIKPLYRVALGRVYHWLSITGGRVT